MPLLQWGALMVLVIIYIGLYNGFYRSLADTPVLKGVLVVDDEEAAPEPERLIGPAPVADGSTLTRSVKDSDREVEDVRRACRITLHVAGLIYSNAVLRSLWMLVGSLIEVFKHEHR